MALAMARPWKHPKTGVYWLRKGVPEDLRALVGKREEKRSLGTKDPAEAKRLHATALAEVEVRWTSLRAGPRTLTEREAHKLAAEYYGRWLALYRDNPSQQTVWRVDLYSRMWSEPPPGGVTGSSEIVWTIDRDELRLREQEAWCLQGAEGVLAAHGLVVDEASKLTLAKALAAAVHRASLKLAQYAQGEFDDEPQQLAAEAGSGTTKSEPRGATKPVLFEGLVSGWAAETKPAPKTLYEWRRVLGHLATFVGHDDAGRLTPTTWSLGRRR
jgi:hypothetical protein